MPSTASFGFVPIEFAPSGLLPLKSWRYLYRPPSGDSSSPTSPAKEADNVRATRLPCRGLRQLRSIRGGAIANQRTGMSTTFILLVERVKVQRRDQVLLGRESRIFNSYSFGYRLPNGINFLQDVVWAGFDRSVLTVQSKNDAAEQPHIHSRVVSALVEKK